jgi:hypothetical protein
MVRGQGRGVKIPSPSSSRITQIFRNNRLKITFCEASDERLRTLNFFHLAGGHRLDLTTLFTQDDNRKTLKGLFHAENAETQRKTEA